MLLTIHDSKLRKVAYIDNSKQGTLNFFNDSFERDLPSGSSTFSFTVFKKMVNSDTVLERAYTTLTERSFVSFRYKGEDFLFNIMSIEETEKTISCQCENLNLELLNEYAPAYKASKAMTFIEYMDEFGIRRNGALTVGVNEVAKQQKTLEWTGEDTLLKRLLSIATNFEAEIEFKTFLNSDSSLKEFKINIFKQHDDNNQGVGKRRGDVLLEYGRNIKGITRKVDKTNIYNMVMPSGQRQVTKTVTVSNPATTSTAKAVPSTYNGGDIKYGGNTLAASRVKTIMNLCFEMNLLPSGVITQLYLESFWGNSNVGRVDNNWGGLTGGAQTRPSGVVVTTGSARPANEGGTYMHFSSVDDYLKDYTYLLGKQKQGTSSMYGVAGKKNIEDYTKGLFRVGGALYDYAAVGYAHYVSSMRSIRDGINRNNNNILNRLDDDWINPKIPNQSTGTVTKTLNPKLQAMINWFSARKGKVTYSMNARTGPSSYDCSSAVYYAMKEAGFTDYTGWPFSTESMHDPLLKNGFELVAENKSIKLQQGDVIVWGKRGYSAGAGGHTMVMMNDTDIIHCNYGGNGITVNNYAAYVSGRNVYTYVYRLKNAITTTTAPNTGGGTTTTVTNKAEKTAEALSKIKALMGQRVGNGQCYGLVAYYSKILGGAGLGGGVDSLRGLVGGGMAASQIGTDYNWAQFGWSVITPRSVDDLKAGAILNNKSNFSSNFLMTGPYGHTVIIKSVSGGNVTVYEQNFAGMQYVIERTYNAQAYLGSAQTIVYPPELKAGKTVEGVKVQTQAPQSQPKAESTETQTTTETQTFTIDSKRYQEWKNAKGEVEFYLRNGCLYAPLSRELYPSVLTGDERDDNWIRKDMKVESDSEDVLISTALRELKKNCYPEITYEVSGYVDLENGDTIKIQDNGYQPALILEARVIEQHISFTNPSSNKTVFSNFKAFESQVSKDLLAQMNLMVEASKPYQIRLVADKGLVFKNGEGETTIGASLFKGNKEVDATFHFKDGEKLLSVEHEFVIKASDINETLILTVEAYVDNELVVSEDYTLTNVVDGAGVESVKTYTRTNEDGNTSEEGEWSETPQLVTKEKPYQISYTETVLTNGKVIKTSPVITEIRNPEIDQAVEKMNQAFDKKFEESVASINSGIEGAKESAKAYADALNQEINDKFDDADAKFNESVQAQANEIAKLFDKAGVNQSLAEEAKRIGEQAKTDAASAMARANQAKTEAIAEATRLDTVERQALETKMNTAKNQAIDEANRLVETAKGLLSGQVNDVSTELTKTKESIKLLANQNSLDELKNRVSTAESSLQVQADQISQRVKTSDFDQAKQRLNSAESSITQLGSRITTEISEVEGKIPTGYTGNMLLKSGVGWRNQHSQTFILADDIKAGETYTVSAYWWRSDNSTLNIGIRPSANDSWQWVNLAYDSNLDCWTATFKATRTISAGQPFYFFTVENSGIGSANWATLVSGAKAMTKWQPSLVEVTENVESVKTTVNQTALGVEQLSTQLTETSGKVTSAETSIKQLVNDVSSKVSQTTFDNLKRTVDSQGTAITQNQSAIALKAEKTYVDGVKSTADSALTKANSNASQISTTRAELQVTNQAIETKASKTDVNNLTGRLNSAETTIRTQAGLIEQRLTSTQVESAINSKGYQTKSDVDSNINGRGYITNSALQPYALSTTVQNLVQETANSFSRTISETKALIPSELSGNLLLKSNIGWSNVHDKNYVLADKLEKGKTYTLVSHYWHGEGATAHTSTIGDGAWNKLAYNPAIDSWMVTFQAKANIPAGARVYLASHPETALGSSTFVTLVKGTIPLSRWEPAYSELATISSLHEVKDTVDSHTRTISDQGNAISQVVQTATGIVSRVGNLESNSATKNDLTATQTQVSQLAGSYAIKNLTSNGQVLNQINLLANGTNRIDGRLTHITGNTLIDNAVIKSAMVDKLKTANFEAGSVTSNIIASEAVTASHLKADNAFFDKLVANDALLGRLVTKTLFSTSVQSIDLSADRVTSGILRATNNVTDFNLNSGNLNFNSDDTGVFRKQVNASTQGMLFKNTPINIGGREYINSKVILGAERRKDDLVNKWSQGGFNGIIVDTIKGVQGNDSDNSDKVTVVGDIIRLTHSYEQDEDTGLSPSGWEIRTYPPSSTSTGNVIIAPYGIDYRKSQLYVGDIKISNSSTDGVWLRAIIKEILNLFNHYKNGGFSDATLKAMYNGAINISNKI